MAHGWSAAGYKKKTTTLWLSGFGSNVTRCILAEAERNRSQRGEKRARVLLLSPAASSLPPLCFLLCRRASSNDLPLLCSAPSAWPWAEAICRLFVPVTSAPMGGGGLGIILFFSLSSLFSELLNVNLRRSVVFIVCGGVMSQGGNMESSTWMQTFLFFKLVLSTEILQGVFVFRDGH